MRSVFQSRSEYPVLLREIPNAPARLYAEGVELGDRPYIGIVGTRNATRQGLEIARQLAGDLVAVGFSVVSGLARGIDAAAHRGALEVGGHTVAVLGCGVDVCYPAINRGLYEQIKLSGTLVSELEMSVRPSAYQFPIRNRIIAGMGCATVVVEARDKGGALITARLASEFGREVFVVPGPVNSPSSLGSNRLIRDGARLVASAADILEDLGMTPQQSLDLSLNPDELSVLRTMQTGPMLLEFVARRAAMPLATASSTLARLEIRGLIARAGGGRFEFTPKTMSCLSNAGGGLIDEPDRS